MPLILPQIRTLVRAIAMTLVTFGTVGTAQAQSSEACLRYRSELANLSDGASTARALQNEIGRLNAYSRTLN